MVTFKAGLVLSTLLLIALPVVAQTTFLGDRHNALNQATQTHERRDSNDKKKPGNSELVSMCGLVIGIEPYCSCLGAGLPPGLSFDQYVVVLSRTKEENSYGALNAAAKRTYDEVPKVRDQCAAVVRPAP